MTHYYIKVATTQLFCYASSSIPVPHFLDHRNINSGVMMRRGGGEGEGEGEGA